MNPNYGIYNSSGNAAHAAYSIEQFLSNRWEHVYSRAHPLLDAIKAVGNFNRGFTIQGNSMLVPIVLSFANGRTTTPSLAVADGTGELTPMTGGETAGVTSARYEFTHMRDRIVLLDSESTFNSTGRARPDLLEAKLEQTMEKFRSDMSTLLGDASSGTAWANAGNIGNSRTTPLSVYCVADIDMANAGTTSQSPGQIPMGGAGNNWATNNQASVGTLTLPILDNALDALFRINQQSGDLILASNRTGGVNVYGKLRFLIGPSQMLVTQDNTANYGFESFTYRGRKVVMDPFVESGNRVAILTSRNWFHGGYARPKQSAWRDIPSTDAREMILTHWYGIACNNWLLQFYLNGITG